VLRYGQQVTEAGRRRLPRRFYERDTLVVARELLGKRLRHGEVVLGITEVEAYCGPDDSASHSRMGRTQRNAPMWGPGGRAYVYLCYGLHQMLNIVTEREGRGAAVLIRACEPVAGLETIRARRRGLSGPEALAGPGRVAAALGIDRSFNDHPLYRAGGVELLDGPPPQQVLVGPRVGIDYATPSDCRRPWRFALAGSRWVSRPRAGLRAG